MKKILVLSALFVVWASVFAQQVYDKPETILVNQIYYHLLTDSTAEVCQNQDNCTPYPSSISIPARITYLGHEYTVTRVGERAFVSCGISSVILPETITEIGKCAFLSSNCASLSLPSSLQVIGYGAFGYSSILAMHIPASVESIDEYAFMSSSIDSFSIDAANPYFFVTDEGLLLSKDTATLVAAIKRISINPVVLPSTVKRILSGALAGCTNITQVVLPQGLKELGSSVFPSTLQRVNIPSSVCSMRGCIIDGVPLASLVVEVDSSSRNYSFEQGRLTSYDGDTLFMVAGVSGVYTVPNNTKVLGNALFTSNARLTEVILPEGLTEIGEDAFSETQCMVNIPSTVQHIGNYAFYRNKGISDVELPFGVRSVERYTFAESNVRTLSLSDSLVNIAEYAFYGCLQLESIRWGLSLETISHHAFSNLIMLGDMPSFPQTLRTIGWAAFDGSSINYAGFKGAPDTIGNGAFPVSVVRFCDSKAPVIYPSTFWCVDSVYIPCRASEIFEDSPFWGNRYHYYEDCDNNSIYEPAVNQIILYPNPAKNHVTILGSHEEILSVTIYSMTGRPVASFHHTATLDLSHLPNSSYIASILTPSGPHHLKLIKK